MDSRGNLIAIENIGEREVIALRRMTCGFIVHPDGSEERLEQTCPHLRTTEQRPDAGGNFIDQAKRRVGSVMARRRGGHWCGDCGCPLAAKTTVGFDHFTRIRYEKLRCPFKKW